MDFAQLTQFVKYKLPILNDLNKYIDNDITKDYYSYDVFDFW